MEAEGTIMGCFDQSAKRPFARQEPSKSHRSSDSAAADERPSANSCFDCSICLDFAAEPVVTLCGHLYCWPCIYKWLQVDTTSAQQCPVCKSPISHNALIPLYGRGSSNFTSKSKGLNVPSRPAASVVEHQHSLAASPHQPVQQHHHHHYYPSPLGGMGVFSSTAGGVLGGLAIAILPLVSRNNQGGGELFFSRQNHLMPSVNGSSPRMQRVENSLHQIWVFLFCCAILGLLFF